MQPKIEMPLQLNEDITYLGNQSHIGFSDDGRPTTVLGGGNHTSDWPEGQRLRRNESALSLPHDALVQQVIAKLLIHLMLLLSLMCRAGP